MCRKLLYVSFVLLLNSYLVADSIEVHNNPVPDGTISVTGDRSDWQGIPWYEIDDDFDEFSPVDIDRVQIAHDSQNVYIHLEALTWDVDESWRVGTYIDLDDDNESGYNGGFLAVGAEYLMEGELFEFTGGAPSEWSWVVASPLERDQTTMTDFEIAIPREALEDPEEFHFVMFANNMCCDFGLPDDVYPNGGGTLFGDFFSYELGEVLLPGDFDGNGSLDVSDLNQLSAAIQSGAHAAEFDLNGDSMVDTADLSVWVVDLKQTWFGDANLDGEFNSGDLVQIFTAGKFELDGDATWDEGDWNADQRFNSGDLVQAFTDGGFEVGPRVGAMPVPEPGLFGIGSLLLLGMLRRVHQRVL